MTDLIQDTGARRESSSPQANDPQNVSTGNADAPGGASAPHESANSITMGQEAYPGGRAAGETDKHTAPDPAEFDPSLNNATTPVAGDLNPDETAVTDATGQAGVNDRPGKDKAHPWNG